MIFLIPNRNGRRGGPACIQLRNNNKSWQAKRKNRLLEFYWIITVSLGRLKNQLEAKFPPETPETIPESLAEKSTSDLTTKAGSLAPCQVSCHGNFTHSSFLMLLSSKSKPSVSLSLAELGHVLLFWLQGKVGTEF